MTPVFAHGSLRLYLLSLLAEQPRHGYELIQALSDRFGGTYIPSAGTIYPRLAKLEEEGLVTKSTDGRKTVYEITDAGRAELLARQGELDAIETEVTDSVRRLADEVRSGVTAAMKSLRADLASAKRQARGEGPVRGAGGTGTSGSGSTGPGADPRAESSRAIHEADMVLNEFRQQLRADLRGQASRSLVPTDTVPELRRRLAEVREGILASLSR
ncbi:PadR family transcriptional regulator [Cryobacterium sp. TMT2-10]|uniref:PadR family transcriptional regulator n=1 Tax=Cryobacterium shii TaxID=1259235 RepID=A0AAQ2HFC4_9MICO|nr:MULTISPECIES: PadR family transcriptional regulator [Cryobacterium]TFC46597.1 PadR family transcriptional regulator [Cryobacterium shii]TFD14113.1 PadR family transcriptional regulator [Cryobacterium sp. TMT4-10]TFD43329.1 PadR family transcriptional regulator [Cryobacterium sp. TMT2-10]